MSWIDWAIVAVPMVVVLYIAVKSNSYVRGVSDFLAGGRVAGRYLVCTASGMAAMGVISVVAACERNYAAGFAISWWGQIMTPIWLMITLTGFVAYRYRETRVFTLAQLFEIRYSRNFRIFAGILGAVSGIINYAIFPAVAGRFFVYYCGLPEYVGPIPTFGIVMLVFLSAALLMVLLGGQLTIIVTDCVQGLFAYAMYLAVAIALLYLFSWHQIEGALMTAPANESLINPFKTSGVKDFNIWFVLIGAFGGVYSIMAWQGTSGFNASAASPHEQKMGGILGSWRGLVFEVMQTLLAISALTYLAHPDFVQGRNEVNQQIVQIADGASKEHPAVLQPDGTVIDKELSTVQKQMRVPVALSHFLPVGIKGILAAIMFFFACTNDVSYLHSWGSIVAQDVILPFRKTQLSPKAHVNLMRWCITGVTIFAFCFSLWFKQTQYIYMYFQITGAIFLGGAGSVIIGGLYWKKGTTSAAWAAMIAGGTLAVTGIVLEQVWLAKGWGPFPLNGAYVSAIAMGTAILLYVTISLLTSRQDFNMEKLLHRGQYAVDENGLSAPQPPKPPRTWKAILGIDENFTRGDKILASALFCWSMTWFLAFAVISIWNLISIWPDSWWATYWHITGIWLPLGLGAVTSVWFTIGGTRDLNRLFKKLKTLRRDANDDGTVPPNQQGGHGFEVVQKPEPETATTH